MVCYMLLTLLLLLTIGDARVVSDSPVTYGGMTMPLINVVNPNNALAGHYMFNATVTPGPNLNNRTRIDMLHIDVAWNNTGVEELELNYRIDEGYCGSGQETKLSAGSHVITAGGEGDIVIDVAIQWRCNRIQFLSLVVEPRTPTGDMIGLVDSSHVTFARGTDRPCIPLEIYCSDIDDFLTPPPGPPDFELIGDLLVTSSGLRSLNLVSNGLDSLQNPPRWDMKMTVTQLVSGSDQLRARVEISREGTNGELFMHYSYTVFYNSCGGHLLAAGGGTPLSANAIVFFVPDTCGQEIYIKYQLIDPANPETTFQYLVDGLHGPDTTIIGDDAVCIRIPTLCVRPADTGILSVSSTNEDNSQFNLGQREFLHGISVGYNVTTLLTLTPSPTYLTDFTIFFRLVYELVVLPANTDQYTVTTDIGLNYCGAPQTSLSFLTHISDGLQHSAGSSHGVVLVEENLVLDESFCGQTLQISTRINSEELGTWVHAISFGPQTMHGIPGDNDLCVQYEVQCDMDGPPVDAPDSAEPDAAAALTLIILLILALFALYGVTMWLLSANRRM